MEAHTDSDQADVSVKTEIAADRIRDCVRCDVVARNWPSNDYDVIILYWDDNAVNGPNSYAKGSIIDDVYQSNAAVELHSACDGEERLTFKLRD